MSDRPMPRPKTPDPALPNEAGRLPGGMRRRQWKRLLRSVRVLRLEPGDVLVLAYPGHLTMEIAQQLKDRLREEFPAYKVMILDSGPTLDVLRSSAHSDGSIAP